MPYIAPDADVAELTPKAVLLGALFGILFGAATVYFALRADRRSRRQFRFRCCRLRCSKKLGKSTILENNIVQTLGSAGESIAAGVVFTVPALLFWRKATVFPLWPNFDAGCRRWSAEFCS